MEPHDPNPKGTSPDPWDTVTSELSALKERLRQTYEEAVSESGPGSQELSDALATLAQAWDRMAQSLGTVLRDPETREHLKRTASSVATALGSTLSQLGSEFRAAASEEE